jgi:hypothetical protein
MSSDVCGERRGWEIGGKVVCVSVLKGEEGAGGGGAGCYGGRVAKKGGGWGEKGEQGEGEGVCWCV